MPGSVGLRLVAAAALWTVIVAASAAEPPGADHPASSPAASPRDFGGGAEAAVTRPSPPARTFSLWDSRAAPPPPQSGAFGLVGTEGPSVRLPGDPDSVFTLGGTSPAGHLRLLAAVEVNDVVLKAIAPDPTIAPNDTRTRAPGAWAPLDVAGRPYQFRLGARLVW